MKVRAITGHGTRSRLTLLAAAGGLVVDEVENSGRPFSDGDLAHFYVAARWSKEPTSDS